MNNSELAETLASQTGTTKADARKAVDLVFAAIADAAAKGEEVSLNGFGKFKVKVPGRRNLDGFAGGRLEPLRTEASPPTLP